MKISQKIVELARKEIGVRESPLNSNCGPRVNQYKAATWLPADKPWYWCAAFICFIVKEAMQALNIKEHAGFKRPQTAGARDFINWSRSQDNSTTTLMHPKWNQIKAGDILVFDDISHIAFADEDGRADGVVITVEGNTGKDGSRNGDGVYRKARKVSQMRARIRINL